MEESYCGYRGGGGRSWIANVAKLCCSRSRPTSVIRSPICRFSAAKSDCAAVSVLFVSVLPACTGPRLGDTAKPSALHALRAIGSPVMVAAMGDSDMGTSCADIRGTLVEIGGSVSEEVGKGGFEDHEGRGSAACSGDIRFTSAASRYG